MILLGDCTASADMIREIERKALGVSSGMNKADTETLWWNEDVQNCLKRKRLAKKIWDPEDRRQKHREMQHKLKVEVVKAKQRGAWLDRNQGEEDLYSREREIEGWAAC